MAAQAVQQGPCAGARFNQRAHCLVGKCAHGKVERRLEQQISLIGPLRPAAQQPTEALCLAERNGDEKRLVAQAVHGVERKPPLGEQQHALEPVARDCHVHGHAKLDGRKQGGVHIVNSAPQLA